MSCHLTHRAFQLSPAGAPLVTFNGRSRLFVDTTRPKPEADPGDGSWEEKYNTHTDSKPFGPQSLSLDLTFHNAPAAFGIPEHAGPFALKTTVSRAAPTADVASGDNATSASPYVSDPYRLYNLDVYEYEIDSTFGLYGSIPVVVAHNPGEPRTVGAFWHNAAEQYVDVSTSTDATTGATSTDIHWFSEAGVIDLFLLPGPEARDVWRGLAALTGAPQLPPLFALGYHQCRWNYKDEADTLAVDAGFDVHDMPYDGTCFSWFLRVFCLLCVCCFDFVSCRAVIWLDIEHTDGKRYLTWDSTAFPTPDAMQLSVASHGERRTVVIVDPHVKRDAAFRMHSVATAEQYYVRTADNASDFEGWCWPGSSSYLDVTSGRIRSWWATQFSLTAYKGSTPWLHVWNDMNEPSVFNGPEVTMQKDLRHGSGAIEHRDVHNQYGAYYHAASFEGLAMRSPSERPFVLSRAFFSGSQRVGAVWTGDNAATWAHLAVSVPMVLSIGAAGLPFAGADVGGFFGDPSPELLARWYQLGVFYPFFRGHAHHDTRRREPWLLPGGGAGGWAASVRCSLRERYALLPYIYSLFAASAGFGDAAAALTGTPSAPLPSTDINASGYALGSPVARPLWAEFPSDAASLKIDTQLMLGPSLLVCPVLTQGATSVACYLPGSAGTDVWYHSLSGESFTGGSTLDVAAPLVVRSVTSPDDDGAVSLDAPQAGAPSFYRGGSVLFRRERARRSSAAQRRDPYTIVACLGTGDAPSAVGDLFMDDGQGTSGVHTRARATLTLASPTSGVLSLSRLASRPPSTGFDDGSGVERLVLLGLPGGPSGWTASLISQPGGVPTPLECGPGPVNSNARPSAPARGFPSLVVRLSPQPPAAGGWEVRLSKAGGAAAA